MNILCRLERNLLKMKQSDKNRFASAFQSMCEILDKKSTTIMISGYFTALENFSIEQTEKAISKAIVENKNVKPQAEKSAPLDLLK